MLEWFLKTYLSIKYSLVSPQKEIGGMELPSGLVKQLTKAGWAPERKISLPDDPLRHQAAKKFLESFGDISIRRTEIEGIDWFDFRYESAQEDVYPVVTKIFSKMLGYQLYVVGECACGHCPIMIDELGRFWIDADTVMHPLGLTVEQALWNLWTEYQDHDKSGLEILPKIDRKLFKEGTKQFEIDEEEV